MRYIFEKFGAVGKITLRQKPGDSSWALVTFKHILSVESVMEAVVMAPGPNGPKSVQLKLKKLDVKNNLNKNVQLVSSIPVLVLWVV